MAASRSDALVLFGATGDLAHKMIFPALSRLVKRSAVKVPVIGVAAPKWGQADLRKRVRDSLTRSSGIDNESAFNHLMSVLTYVSGDYNDAATSTAINKALGGALRPAHYLAIPPMLFATVIKGLGAAKLVERARVIVEKPFGRDLASAGLNRIARSVFPEDSILRQVLGRPDGLHRIQERSTEMTHSTTPTQGIRFSTYGVLTVVRNFAVDGWGAESFRPPTPGHAGRDKPFAMTENSIAFWYHMMFNHGRISPAYDGWAS